jgi:hypothetical protein
MFENWVLRRIFEPNRNEIKGEWKRVCNEELNGLYFFPDIIRVIKRRIRWAGHIASMGETKGTYEPKERDHLEDPVESGRIIFECIFKKWDGELGLD